MKIYTDPLTQIRNFYTDKNLLQVIDGERTLEVIVEDMDSFIQSKI
jgi:adenylate kinase